MGDLGGSGGLGGGFNVGLMWVVVLVVPGERSSWSAGTPAGGSRPLGFLTLVVEQLVLQFLRPEYIEQLRVVQYVFRLVLVQVKLGRVAQLRVFGY